MNFDVDEQQAALQASIGRFCKSVGEASLERVIRDGYAFDRPAWQRLADQIGVPGLAIAEQYGGSGAGATEVVLALEELGKACYSSPYLSTAIATATLSRLSDVPAVGELLASIASGQAVVTFAMRDPGGGWSSHGFAAQASDSTGTVTVSGTKNLVRDVGSATHFIVPALSGGAPALYLVASDADQVTVLVEAGLDPGCEIGRVTFDAVAAGKLADGDRVADLLERAAGDAAVYLAAECLGLAAGALRRSVEWSLQREQFGRPIGVHQSLKHMCADTLMEVEAARVLVYFASTQTGTDATTYTLAASHAMAQAASAAHTATANLIQILGGIGFTWEHPAHLYFKRARVNGILAGSTTQHLDRIADAVLPAKG